MTYMLALLAAIVGGGAGFLLGTTAGSLLAPALGISSFEGASGYFAVLCGLIGLLIGFVGGAIWMLRRRGVRSPGAIAGRVALMVAGAFAIVAAGIAVVPYLMQGALNPNGAPPRLVFEIRLPVGATMPTGRDPGIELQTSQNRMPATVDRGAGRRNGDRAVIAGSVEMYYRTSQRTLVLTMPDKTDVLFNVALGARPAHSREFGAWRRADHIAEPGKDQARRATAADHYEIRYRAQWAGED